MAVWGRGDHRPHGFLGAEAAGQKIEGERAKPRISAVLREHGPDAGLGIGAARTDGNGGRRHDGSQHAGSGAASDQGEGHVEASAITAVMSTSISSTGLANPLTINALKAGLAPPKAPSTTSQTPARNARSVTNTLALTTSESLAPASPSSTATLCIACSAWATALPRPCSTS